MRTTSAHNSGGKDLRLLVDRCMDILARCQPTAVQDTDGKALALSILLLRLQGRKPHLQTLEDADVEAAQSIAKDILEDLLEAEQKASARSAEQDMSLERTTGVAVLARHINSLALSPQRNSQDTSQSWFPPNSKLASRLVEDLSEKIDALVQLTQRDERDHAPLRGDATSAFWLGIAAVSLADAQLRAELARYAADNIEGFEVTEVEGDRGAGLPATFHRGSTYSNISAAGRSKIIMGDSFGKYVLDDN